MKTKHCMDFGCTRSLDPQAASSKLVFPFFIMGCDIIIVEILTSDNTLVIEGWASLCREAGVSLTMATKTVKVMPFSM